MHSQLSAFSFLEGVIDKVSQWMTENKQKLNQSKTEFMILGTRNQVKKIKSGSLRVGGDDIKAKPSVRNLGAHFDIELKMIAHINHVLKMGYFHIRRISVIRKYLSQHATKTLVHATILARMDYANALLYGIPETQLNRLQRLQNRAARLITKDSSLVESRTVLRKLHWLPVRARIKFKVILLAFKALHNLAPPYIRDILSVLDSTRCTIQSSSGVRLVEPRSKLKFGGDRAFSICAPRLWYSLPCSLRCETDVKVFKKHLKTILFNEYLS